MSVSQTTSKTVVLKFEQQAEHNVGQFKKILGLVKAKNLIELINVLDLEANPRSSRVGAVTEAIDDSLKTTPDIFAFKTKGMLLGASSYEVLERKRVRISFEEPEIEGILDGGHNCLAIGLHILETVLGSREPLKKVKTWSQFRDAWSKYHKELQDYLAQSRGSGSEQTESNGLDVLVPIELLVPVDPNDEESINEFASSLLDICSARNNNVQLKVEAKANQSGYFDFLKEHLPKEVSQRVEWKTNESEIRTEAIKATDIVALAWIPLSVIDPLPSDEDAKPVTPPPPQNIYRSKGDCMNRFERLMRSESVTTESGGRSTVHDPKVISALELASDLPGLYDVIYEQLPKLYNKDGGKFGNIKPVRRMNPENSRQPKRSKFLRKPVDFNVPEGFVVPIVWGLRTLIGRKPDGTVYWRTDPYRFLEEHLPTILPQITGWMSPLNFDPQKFGKEEQVYKTAATAFEIALLQSGASQQRLASIN